MEQKGLVAGSVLLTLGVVISIGLMVSGPEEAGPSGSSAGSRGTDGQTIWTVCGTGWRSCHSCVPRRFRLRAS